MVLKLYTNANGMSAKLVAVVLHEKKVPFEFHNVNLMKGEHRSAEHLKYQPFGKVPYIDDDGFILYESRAIARYIATKYAAQGTPLLPNPSDVKKQALFEQAASVEMCNFDKYASQVVFEGFIKPTIFGAETDREKLKADVENLEKTLDVYEQILSGQKYVAGDSLTLADLFHIPYASFLPKSGVDVIQKRSNVASSRDAWKAVENGIESSST